MKRRHAPRTLRQACVMEPLDTRRLFAAGVPDLSFSSDGSNTIDFGNGVIANVTDVAVQPDGKTVVVGSTHVQKFAIARFNLDGTPDPTFGDKGRVLSAHGKNGVARGVAIQGDGKIVVVGFANDRMAIGRFNPNGTFDKTFSGDGKQSIDFGVMSKRSAATCVFIQNDGKIVIGGVDTNYNNLADVATNTTDQDLAFARLLPNGNLDNSFDSDGKRVVSMGENWEEITSIAPAPGGRIVGVGSLWNDFHTNERAVVVRLNANGSNDKSFDGDGVATLKLNNANTIGEGLVVQNDGRVVVTAKTGNDLSTARFNVGGGLDPSFGNNGAGWAVTNLGGQERSFDIVRAADGGLIVAGLATTGVVGGPTTTGTVIVKYDANGKFDSTFGDKGKIYLSRTSVPHLAAGAGKRFVVSSGSQFQTTRFLQAGSLVVSCTPIFDAEASEAGKDPATFFVTRSERLPWPTRVYLTTTGTATAPSFVIAGQENLADYTGWYPNVILGQRSYVDIPANQTFTTITITPIDDNRREGRETVTIGVLPGDYDIGVPQGTVVIHDNDVASVGAAADTFVRDGDFQNTAPGSLPNLEVRNTGGQNRLTYLKFDLRGFNAIGTATLRLFGRYTGAGSSVVGVFSAADTSWTEAGLKWTNRPPTGANALANTTIHNQPARWYQWDVSGYLKSQKAAGKQFATLVLKNVSATPAHATFQSRETGDLGPQLWVTP